MTAAQSKPLTKSIIQKKNKEPKIKLYQKSALT